MKRSIRWQLLWFALLTVVPSLVVLGGIQWMTRARTLKGTIQESRRVTHLAAAEQTAFFSGTDRLLRTLSAAHLPDGPECSQILADVRAEHAEYLNLSIVDRSGRVVCSALLEAVGQSVTDRDWFQRAVAGGRLVISDFQIGRVTGKPDVMVAVPKRDAAGSVTHVLVAAIEVTQFSAAAATAELPPGAVLTVLDPKQTILYRYPDAEKWVGKQAPASAAIDRIRTGAADDVRNAVSVDGVARLWTTVPVPTGGDAVMTLAIGIPNAAAFAEANDLFRQSVWLFVLVLIATSAVAALAGERFVIRPLHQLAVVTRRLGTGDLAARVQLVESVPGIRDLADAINEMAIALEDRRRDEERLRVLVHAVESTNEMVSVTDLDDRLTFVNRAFLTTYGYTSDEVLGRTPVILGSPNTPPSIADEILRETRKGGWHGELLNRRKDGSEIFISLNTSPILDDRGMVVGLLGVARDISERLNAERALREAEERMRFALAASGVGIWEINFKSGGFFGSDIHEAMHGQTPRAFAGTLPAFLERVHVEDRRRVGQTLTAASLNRDAEFEYRTIWPDGSEHWIRASATCTFDDAGQPLRGVGIAVDITERRMLEAQLRQAGKMEAVGQLAGGIAHDFNNLLTVILGSAELLLKEAKGTQAAQELEQIRTAGLGAAALTRQLLAFSRKQMLQPKVFDLNEVVSGLSPLIRRVIGEDLNFCTRLAPHLDHVIADRSQLEQVVLNLAVNARDAMPHGGTLTIETANATLDAAFVAAHAGSSTGSFVRLSLSDTGVGMDNATKARMFEPFFTTKELGKGTGLGLATVYGIVKQSGGYISADSAPGSGSTFHVYLPRTADKPATATEPGKADGGTETVLLVEDDPGVRALATRILRSGGYNVLVSENPFAALEIARQHSGPIHALLTDVVMPGMNGIDLATRVLEERGHLHVLLMSGYPNRELLPGDLPAGAGLMAKPFSPNSLLEEMRKLLDTVAGAPV